MDILAGRRILKFIGVGALNTCVGYAVYALIVMVGFSFQVALFVATVLGVLFNYISYGRIVFKADNGFYPLVKFVVAYTIIYGFNAVLLYFIILAFSLNEYMAQAICLVPSVALSWLLMNFWVYKRSA